LSSHLFRSIKIKKYKIIIVQDVYYGCEIWSFTLRKEHRTRVSVNTVVRTGFGLQREEVVGGWRKLHNEQLHNLYSQNNRLINSGKRG
jgi:hypothetical protein